MKLLKSISNEKSKLALERELKKICKIHKVGDIFEYKGDYYKVKLKEEYPLPKSVTILPLKLVCNDFLGEKTAIYEKVKSYEKIKIN